MDTARIPESQDTAKAVMLSLSAPEDMRRALRMRTLEEVLSVTKLGERPIREYLSTDGKRGDEP